MKTDKLISSLSSAIKVASIGIYIYIGILILTFILMAVSEKMRIVLTSILMVEAIIMKIIAYASLGIALIFLVIVLMEMIKTFKKMIKTKIAK